MKIIRGEAILFDLDGVLVDSLASVVKHWSTWAERVELDADYVLARIHGRRGIDSVRLLTPHLEADVEAAFIEHLETTDTSGLVPVAGAHALLEALPMGRWTIVTSGSRGLATARLAAVGHAVPERFVSGDLVSRGKPDPEGYLKGAKLLGMRPEHCIVFEDAEPGVAAAHAAGMQAVAVGNTYTRDELRAAEAWVPTLEYVHVRYMPGEELPLELTIREAEDN